MGTVKVIRKKTPYGKKFDKALDAMVSSSGKDRIGVGWYGDQIHNESDTPLSDIAYVNENGGIASTEGPDGEEYVIPPRPFMGPAVNKNRNLWRKEIFALVQKAFATGKGNLDDLFMKVGKTVRSDIKKSIRAGGKQKLSDYTIKLREERGNMSKKPLIDTSQFINSIEIRKLK